MSRNKKLPRSLRAYVRREKSRIRKAVTHKDERARVLVELSQRFFHDAKEEKKKA